MLKKQFLFFSLLGVGGGGAKKPLKAHISFVCRCTLGWRTVASHFQVTVTLISDIDF